MSHMSIHSAGTFFDATHLLLLALYYFDVEFSHGNNNIIIIVIYVTYPISLSMPRDGEREEKKKRGRRRGGGDDCKILIPFTRPVHQRGSGLVSLFCLLNLRALHSFNFTTPYQGRAYYLYSVPCITIYIYIYYVNIYICIYTYIYLYIYTRKCYF